jgi:hypothetical protein
MPANVFLVRWVGGWTQVDRGGFEIRREACLGLGAQQSLEEARRVAGAQLDAFADVRDEIATEPAPMGPDDTPWLAYRTGDYVVVPTWSGSHSDQRVISMGGALDDNGRITFSVELHDRILGERERTEQALKKMVNGTLRGASKVATPTGMVGKRNIPPPPGSTGD